MAHPPRAYGEDQQEETMSERALSSDDWLELIDGWPLEHCAGCADLQAAHGLTDGECIWNFHQFPRPLQVNGIYT